MTTDFIVLISSDHGGRQVGACEMGGKIVAHQLAHGLSGLDRSGRVVRLEKNVVELEEAGVKLRLPFKHVECRRAESAGLQRVEQSVLINVGSARNVDQHAFCAKRLDD